MVSIQSLVSLFQLGFAVCFALPAITSVYARTLFVIGGKIRALRSAPHGDIHVIAAALAKDPKTLLKPQAFIETSKRDLEQFASRFVNGMLPTAALVLVAVIMMIVSMVLLMSASIYPERQITIWHAWSYATFTLILLPLIYACNYVWIQKIELDFFELQERIRRYLPREK